MTSFLLILSSASAVLCPLFILTFSSRYGDSARAIFPFAALPFLFSLLVWSVRLLGDQFNAFAVRAGYEPVTDWYDFFRFLLLSPFGGS